MGVERPGAPFVACFTEASSPLAEILHGPSVDSFVEISTAGAGPRQELDMEQKDSDRSGPGHHDEPRVGHRRPGRQRGRARFRRRRRRVPRRRARSCPRPLAPGWWLRVRHREGEHDDSARTSSSARSAPRVRKVRTMTETPNTNDQAERLRRLQERRAASGRSNRTPTAGTGIHAERPRSRSEPDAGTRPRQRASSWRG